MYNRIIIKPIQLLCDSCVFWRFNRHTLLIVCSVLWFKGTQANSSIFCYIYFFSVRLLSVLRGHSFFSSPQQRPMTSNFEGFLYRILSITLFSYPNSWERASISLYLLSAKQGNYWYHFYKVFGMTRSLTGDWTRDLPHSKPALYH